MNWPRQNKYHAQKATTDGILFHSKAEGEMAQLLKADSNSRHIDYHVPVTLPGGIRFNIDFLVWLKDKEKPEAIEVKGFSTQDFRTRLKLFNATHPLAPLKVYKRIRGKWVSM